MKSYLATNLEYLRKKAGLTRQEMADRLGLTDQSTIRKWENDINRPTAKMLEVISKEFNVDMNDLFFTNLELNEDLSNGNFPTGEYYIDPETAKAAQEALDKAGTLFDAARDATPEQIQQAVDFLNFLKGTNPDG